MLLQANNQIFDRAIETEVLIKFLSWISGLDWKYYLTIHNHSKRDTASDTQELISKKGAQEASAQLTGIKHGDKLLPVYKNCILTESSCNAKLCPSHLKTGMQKLNIPYDFGITTFFSPLPEW